MKAGDRFSKKAFTPSAKYSGRPRASRYSRLQKAMLKINLFRIKPQIICGFYCSQDLADLIFRSISSAGLQKRHRVFRVHMPIPAELMGKDLVMYHVDDGGNRTEIHTCSL